MTIGANNRNNAIGNGATAVYPYGFKIFAATDLRVTVRDPDSNVEYALSYPTHYSVSGVGLAAGGNITLAGSGNAWQDGSGNLDNLWPISIRRVRPLTQTTDIRNQGNYRASIHEDTFDKLAMIDQQQQDEIDRSVKLPETVGSVDATLPVPDALTFIGWNSLGTALVNYAGLAGVAVSSVMEAFVGAASKAAARTELSVYSIAESVAAFVGLTGNQTIAGVKTFSSKPVLPATTPTGNEAASAAYVAALLVNLPVVAQVVEGAPNTTYSSITTALPYDNSIPQSGEGGEVCTVTITPTSASSRLLIEAQFFGTSTSSGTVIALFQGATADAIAAGALTHASDVVTNGSIRCEMAAGTTSATTFKLRAGNNGGATTYVNGSSGGRLFGGVGACRIKVTEIKS